MNCVTLTLAGKFGGVGFGAMATNLQHSLFASLNEPLVGPGTLKIITFTPGVDGLIVLQLL